MKFSLAFSWTLSGTISFALAQWLVIIIIVKFASVSDLGMYALATALVSPVFALSNMGLRSIAATDVNLNSNKLSYCEARLLSIALATGLLLTIINIANLGENISTITKMMICVKAIESMSDITYGFRQHQDAMNVIAISLISRSALMVSTTFFTGFLFSGIISIAYALIFSYAIVFLMFDLRLPDYFCGKKNLKIDPWKFFSASWHSLKLIKIGFPLGIVVGLNILIMQMPRFTLIEAGGGEVLGYFAGMVYFISAGAVIINAVGQTMLTRLANTFNENRVAFLKLWGMLMGFGFLVALGSTICSVLFGDLILFYVYSPGFALYKWEFVAIIAAGGVLYMSALTGSALTAARDYRSQVTSSVAALIFTSLALLFLVPLYHLLGAGLSMIIGFTAKWAIQISALFQCLKAS